MAHVLIISTPLVNRSNDELPHIHPIPPGFKANSSVFTPKDEMDWGLVHAHYLSKKNRHEN
jgi:hypothetical protein